MKNNASDDIRTFVRHVVGESKKFVGMTDVLPYLNQFVGRPIIFFDTETLGLSPRGNQLTEVAGVVAMMKDWAQPAEVIDQFNLKATLSPRTKWRLESEDMTPAVPPELKKKRGLTSREILKMTQYDEPSTEYVDERVLLKRFSEFVNKHPDGVLVAHNAPFDVKFINLRLERMNLPRLPRMPVIDSLQLVRFYLSPVLSKMSNEEVDAIASQATRGKYGKISMKLGDLAKTFRISSDKWHSAIADVEMMMAVIATAIGVIQRNPIERGSPAGKEQEKEWLSFMKRRRGELPRRR